MKMLFSSGLALGLAAVCLAPDDALAGDGDLRFTMDGALIDDEVVAPIDDEPKVSFRHKSTRSFKVGKYQFKNHIMTIPKSDEDEFIKTWRGLQGPDRVAIVRLKNVENEEPVRPSRTTRSSLASNEIPNPTKNAPVTGADTAGTDGEQRPPTRLGIKLPGQ